MAKQGFVWYGKGTTPRYRTAKFRVCTFAEDDQFNRLKKRYCDSAFSGAGD